jgi:hypothetical protein
VEDADSFSSACSHVSRRFVVVHRILGSHHMVCAARCSRMLPAFGRSMAPPRQTMRPSTGSAALKSLDRAPEVNGRHRQNHEFAEFALMAVALPTQAGILEDSRYDEQTRRIRRCGPAPNGQLTCTPKHDRSFGAAFARGLCAYGSLPHARFGRDRFPQSRAIAAATNQTARQHRIGAG